MVPQELRHSAAAFDFLEETGMDANILSLHSSKTTESKKSSTPRKDSARLRQKSIDSNNSSRQKNSSRLSKTGAPTPSVELAGPTFNNPFVSVDKSTTISAANDFSKRIEKLLKDQYVC